MQNYTVTHRKLICFNFTHRSTFCLYFTHKTPICLSLPTKGHFSTKAPTTEQKKLLFTHRVSPPDPRPEGRGPRRFFDFSGRESTFFRNSLHGEVGSGRRRRSVAKGWGPGTRERQHASRDTIPERWGERTHPRTQAQMSLNRSALAAARLQLPTLASGVGKLRLPTGVYM